MVKNASRRTFVMALCSAALACGLAVAPLAFADTAATGDKAGAAQTGETREFTDSLGRTVEIPAEITAIAPSGYLPLQVLLTVAPEKMVCLASSLTAIEGGNYCEVPSEPYNWLNGPPSVNQVLGMQWLPRVLYPEKFDDDMYETVAAYYKTMYQYDLSEDEFNEITARAVPVVDQK